MESMREIAHAAIAQVPPECRVTADQAATIAGHADALLVLGGDVVQTFYDTLYSYDETASIFVEGERPMREKTLVDWWERTVRGPIDDDYWAWMALVGLTHVNREVTNPMMLAMVNHIARFVDERVEMFDLSHEEQRRIATAFRSLSATAAAIITYAYDHAASSAVKRALFDIAGMPESLLRRLRDQEVDSALEKARGELSSRPGA